MERELSLRGKRFTQTDIVRFFVIISLSLCAILITAVTIPRNDGILYAQLFYFPILYATYFYPKDGIILSGLCGIVYECLVYVTLFPDAVALWSATGQAVLFICVALAVAYFTNRIRVSEARYRSIFENSLLGIVLFDKNRFTIRMANQQLAGVLGYTTAELAQISFADLFFSPEYQRQFFERLGSGQDIRNFETCFVTKDGRPRWVNLSWSRIDETIISCSVIDIDAEVRARKEAADRSVQYRQVTESSPTGIVIAEGTTIRFANPAFSTITGYDPAEYTGRDLKEIIIPEDQERFAAFAGRWTAAAPVPDRAGFCLVTKKREVRRAVLYFTPITRDNLPACLINIIDNTEWEEYREQVEQTKERRREMMREVAQELMTPLQPVVGDLTLLVQDSESFGLTGETRQILERCLTSMDSERRTISHMLELSALEDEAPDLVYSVFPLHEMVASVIAAGGYARKADIVTDIPPGITFDADRRKVASVLDTLIANSIAYSKPPKKIWIAYRSSPGLPFHQLAVQDNGLGFSEARLDEIFTPDNEGNAGGAANGSARPGLSLTIAKKYIQLHGGYISVESIMNIGSTFTIHIPKVRPQNNADERRTP
ncbi:PAS domain-containing sensor histidine kinase [Methanoregula sp. UBA64]|jgi:PAS domain S-box-containing protein|uniref:sensor histidine kinase n=1 Tax=Methanoregula sp. UBA64 TaxID=1915554 RepID=UPI0025FFE77F|nr:PAS domain-containing sensor histidine kinase [Methanoregula sp. UBA64]